MLHAAELEPEMEARPADQQDKQHDRQYQNTDAHYGPDGLAAGRDDRIRLGESRLRQQHCARLLSLSNHGAQLACFTAGQVPVEASVEFGPTIFGPPGPRPKAGALGAWGVSSGDADQGTTPRSDAVAPKPTTIPSRRLQVRRARSGLSTTTMDSPHFTHSRGKTQDHSGKKAEEEHQPDHDDDNFDCPPLAYDKAAKGLSLALAGLPGITTTFFV
jgi:hypothetical protein